LRPIHPNPEIGCDDAETSFKILDLISASVSGRTIDYAAAAALRRSSRSTHHSARGLFSIQIENYPGYEIKKQPTLKRVEANSPGRRMF
jgi:hypothetical protein